MVKILSKSNCIKILLCFNAILLAKEITAKTSSERFNINQGITQPFETFNRCLSDSVREIKNRKRTAAILAFPVPFGIFGGHRIFLGTKPNVPVSYIATLGGCVGILPFIDFIVILLDKDIEKYRNNSKIFMWNK